MNMKAYSTQFKTDLINKYLNSSNITITEFTRQNNINYMTFKKWLDTYGKHEAEPTFKEALIEEPARESTSSVTFNLNTMEMKLTMEQAVELIKRYGRL